MKNKKLTELSNDELLKSEKKIKALMMVFGGVLIILLITVIFSMIKKGFSSLIATPIALLPILIIGLNNWNELRKEIKSRNL